MNPQLFRRILICLLSVSLVTACQAIQAEETSVPPSGDNYGQLSDQGKLRTYYLYTPKSYNPDRPMPLVLVFHGDDGSGHSMAEVTRFNDLAEQKGFIVAYPDAVDHKWSLSAKSSRKVDDVPFVAALINHLKQVRNIDSRRVYATGFSRGGILTQDLACKLPDKIAAFASVAGALPSRLKPHCQPQTPVSMLMINGTNDQDVHYDGDDTSQGKGLVSIPDTVSFWRSRDQCPSPTQTLQIPHPNASDRFKVKTSQPSACIAGSEVVQLAVLDGGHFWPGGATQDPKLKQVNNQLGFNASEKIWEFFQRHKMGSGE
ncbi:MAG: dienelactone hydrolase family protein [Stigonema ocellatum SAG 48.90 = DSM 106950]|nr:dienelactone hydrolase family protein [Stigonema ocellatum SAG 48.90 = DSM 106950]